MKQRSVNAWRELFALHAASGLSAQQFCRENDLCAKYFSLRKKQLGEPDAASAFVPLMIKPAATRHTPQPERHADTITGMQVMVGACVVQFNVMPDAAWLALLLRSLA